MGLLLALRTLGSSRADLDVHRKRKAPRRSLSVVHESFDYYISMREFSMSELANKLVQEISDETGVSSQDVEKVLRQVRFFKSVNALESAIPQTKDLVGKVSHQDLVLTINYDRNFIAK